MSEPAIERQTPPIDLAATAQRAAARAGTATAIYRRYTRWNRLSRTALIAFSILAGVFIVWLVPWFPSGLDAQDYTPQFAFTIYLLGAVTFIALAATMFRELARRDRESLLALGTVYDEATGLHNRAYLFDRLFLECSRAQRLGGTFSLFVLQVRLGQSEQGQPVPSLPKTALPKSAEAVQPLIHPTDLVALVSDGELGVLVVGAGQEHRRALQEQLRHAVVGELPRHVGEKALIDVKAGVATYGIDGNDPPTLVQAARTATLMASPERALAS